METPLTSDEPAGRLYARQLFAFVRLSLWRYLHSRHIWAVSLLAGIPVVIASLIATFTFFRGIVERGPYDASELRELSEGMFQNALLRFGLIFIGVYFGQSVQREEFDDQTLHYVYLSPMPRWNLIAGKFLAFMLMAIPILYLTHVITKVMLALPLGFAGMVEFLFTREQLTALFVEFAVITIALFVYSSIFLALSSIFRNVIFALFIYGWEVASSFLPGILKYFTVSYYLREMLPHQVTQRSQQVVALGGGEDPASPWFLFIVLAGTFVFMMALGGFLTARKECLYGNQ